MDWQKFALQQVKHVSEQMMEAHRGAYPIQDGVCVVFGNDGYGPEGTEDQRARAEVQIVREWAKANATELAFATDPDDEERYTWVVVVQSSDVDTLQALVWEAWQTAAGGEWGTQKLVAASVLVDHSPEFISAN